MLCLVGFCLEKFRSYIARQLLWLWDRFELYKMDRLTKQNALITDLNCITCIKMTGSKVSLRNKKLRDWISSKMTGSKGGNFERVVNPCKGEGGNPETMRMRNYDMRKMRTCVMRKLRNAKMRLKKRRIAPLRSMTALCIKAKCFWKNGGLLPYGRWPRYDFLHGKNLEKTMVGWVWEGL